MLVLRLLRHSGALQKGTLTKRVLCLPNCATFATDLRMSTAAKLAGKVAVVTASTEGIGLAIARRLGQDGAHVVISSRKETKVEKALQQLQSEGLSVAGIVCHVAKSEDRKRLIAKALEKNGGIDILVSNAAANPHMGPMLETTEEQWNKLFDTNVKAGFFLIKEVAPHMQKKRGGSIVLVSSIGGYVPLEMLGPYGLTKTALLGLVKNLAPQCSKLGIRVNAIAPGVIKTKFSSALWTDETLSTDFLKVCPMGRFGEPDECAGAVSFLCSNDASYITGETLCIAGGMVSRL